MGNPITAEWDQPLAGPICSQQATLGRQRGAVVQVCHCWQASLATRNLKSKAADGSPCRYLFRLAKLGLHQMDHLGDWHGLDAQNTSTYLKVNSPMQVKYANGDLAVGYTFDFFPSLKMAQDSAAGTAPG
jgi:hypothetical protein